MYPSVGSQQYTTATFKLIANCFRGVLGIATSIDDMFDDKYDGCALMQAAELGLDAITWACPPREVLRPEANGPMFKGSQGEQLR